ncbi:MAG TPA: hypothetical protein VM325_15690 [Alphaproteobacteria bacterium]|nr:hypothetical protein [Alphaproteobacteria bacterium]
MDSAPAFISSMANGAAQQDGSAVAFEIETNDGQRYPFACATVDVEKVVSWLIGLGVLADNARRAQGGGEPAPKASMNATPVPVKQVTLGAGQGAGEVAVAFDMGLFDLAFNLPQEAAKKLHAALGSAIGS